MALSLSDCKAVTEECKQALEGGLIQKIHQPQPFILTFDIRRPGESWTLLISVEPGLARLHITANKSKNPPTPLQFCQYIRSHLDGGRIESIEQEPGDRIVYINIVKTSAKYVLVVALTGNQSNVFVLNEERIIIRSLKPSRMETGQPYVPPPVPTHNTLPTPDRSPSLRTNPVQGEEIEVEKLSRQNLPSQALPYKGEDVKDRFPMSAELEKRYHEQQESQKRLEWFKSRTTHIRKSLKQATRRCQTLEADLAKAEKYREYQRYGELLKSQLHTLKPRQSVIEVVDYYDPALPTLSLPLNELKDPVWNMEDYFRKYRKYLSAQEHLRPRLEQTREKIESLKEEMGKLEKEELDELIEVPASGSSQTTTETHPHTRPSPPRSKDKALHQRASLSIPERLDGLPNKAQKGKASPQTKHYRTFESVDGLAILVGKSALDNDYLTLKVARPDDLWLHARGCPGSHVVVRLEKATDVPHETLRDAATLALFYSDLKKSGKGEVIYTLKKFVKKSKGLKAGAVHVTREKSVWIELKKDRLDRLKGGI
ncbi:Rqc2 family fibronectin-binding protein [Nitrospira sp. M1]